MTESAIHMPPMPEKTTVRFNEEDLALLEAIQKKTGIVSRSEVLRLAIRALAEQESVNTRKRGR